MIIALSGPAASGKGTLAKMLAKHFSLPHYDLGLIFRAIAYTNTTNYNRLKLVDGKIIFRGSDITDKLLSEQVGLAAAKTADTLKEKVLSFVKHKSFVCDGRTAGTEIYPNADYKFYITADINERIKRRSKTGGNVELMIEREQLDAKRLKIPDDAVIIDTTGKSKEYSLKEILSYFPKGT